MTLVINASTTCERDQVRAFDIKLAKVDGKWHFVTVLDYIPPQTENPTWIYQFMHGSRSPLHNPALYDAVNPYYDYVQARADAASS